MNRIFSTKNLYISKSSIPKAGRGVFTNKAFRKGEVIERCPVYVLSKKDYPIIKKTSLRNYYLMWGKSTAGICLGYGSLYNHSYNPNATYNKNTSDKTIEFIAIKNIKKTPCLVFLILGPELFIEINILFP